jgi:hypothetical protein
MSGAVSASGLVPQVKRALAWARSHGWSGSVTSGFRSSGKQQYLWDHAAQLGLIRGVSVARPGSSEHERGRAVDVSDIGGFQHAMASAPANARLLWRGPSDPVHFSVSGHARGGFIRRMARGGRAWTHSELAKLWVQAGGPASVSDVAAAVAQAESSGKPGASSHNPVSGGTNVGLWQIDSGSHSGASTSPFANAKLAVSIWRAAGGTFRKDWEAYTNGSYRQFLSGSNVGKSVAANLGGGGISVRQGFVTQHGGLAFAPLTVGLHGKAPAGLGPGPVSRANAMIARAQMPWDQADTDQENSLIVQGIDPEGAQGIGVRALSAQTRLISLRAQRKRLVAARKQAQRSGNKAGARHASAAIKAIDSRILAQRASITQLGTAYAEATAPAPVDDTADTSAADNAQALIDSLNTLNDTLRNMGAITASVGASQHATILQGLADYFSGQIGSSAFLASQTPATAGVRSRY